ncbi:apolipoprotein acyltransferase [Actibacterium sp. D379-3]
MIVIAGAIIGALWGGLLARRRKGTGFDIAQYAVGFAIAFGLLGMILTIIIERMA